MIQKELLITTKKTLDKLIHAKIKNVCSSKVTLYKKTARWSTGLEKLPSRHTIDKELVCSFICTHCCCYCLVTQLYLTLCDAMDFSTSGFLVLHCLPELAQIHVHWVADAIEPSPSAFNLSHHQVFSNGLTLRIRWPKYWSFSFSISPSNEYSGLTAFRLDWFDLLTVKKNLSRVFSNTTVWKHQFFSTHLQYGLNPYMTTGKTMALTIWSCVSKAISLLFNTLSRFVIVFLPRKKKLNFF